VKSKKEWIEEVTNKKTKDFYIGQSKNLYNRFLNYFNPAYLKRFPNSIIGRAVIKYGYSNFSLTILEYCDKANLTAREQYHPFGVDTLNPVSSILHTATDLQSSYFKKSIINISSWRSSLELLSCRETVRAKVPDGLLGNKLIIRSYSEAEAPQTCSSLLDPWYVTGLTDAEGYFTIKISKKNNKYYIDITLGMQLHLKDIALLESLKSYFKVGNVFVRKTADVASFEVYSIESILDKVIPHFDRYPLLTQKRADYELFKMVAEKMISKVHLTEKGLEEIIAIKASSPP